MALRERLKQHLCGRELQAGDLVKVTDGANWKEHVHPIGGRGHWGIFVKFNKERPVVRPVGANNIPGQPVDVRRVEHLDDVIQSVAVKEYMDKRGGEE